MNTSKILLAAALAAAFGAAQAQSASQPDPDQGYVKRIDTRFAGFAGSSTNLESLAVGLRHGSEITLTGSGETVHFTSPTRPMGYGNITRALDLAMRELAAAGIKDPTPSEIQAALNGGTVSTPTGDVTLRGVLDLRAQGMGWGQIAHAIGVHPGLGSGKPLPAPATSASGITTAAGTAAAKPGTTTGHGAQSARSAAQGGAIVNAAGNGSSASAPGLGLSKGQGGANANGKAAGRI
jgi:hypothetical protein